MARETSTTSGAAKGPPTPIVGTPSPNPTSRAASGVASSIAESPRGNTSSTNRGHAEIDAQLSSAPVGGSLLDGHNGLLLILSASLDDIEGARIATSNRLFAFEERKMGNAPEAETLRRIVKGFERDLTEKERESGRVLIPGLKQLEKAATADLERAMKAHPLGGWVEATVGIGLKQGARLIAALGDIAARPNVARLRQYAGHGDPLRSRQSADNVRIELDPETGKKRAYLPFSPIAKMRTRMVAESCEIQDGMPDKNGKPRPLSPYRSVYDREKAKWADRDTTDGHKHNHALRVVGKAILRDLWIEARRTSV